MKYILAFAATLAAVAVIGDSSVIRAIEDNSNINVGFITASDKLLFAHLVNQEIISPTAIQTIQLSWHGGSTTVFTAIRAYEVEAHQNATARIVGGGIGENTVTIRFESARGGGIHYFVELYGREGNQQEDHVVRLVENSTDA